MVTRKLLLSALLALALCLPAAAADYHFKVNDLKATLTVQADGNVALHYAIRFTPQPGSHPVDIVDIGMPNESYELGSARAAIAGRPLSDIRNSEYVKPGVEVHLGASAIAPGDTGTLEFSILLTRMVYPDSESAEYASLQFKTTWYDGKFVAGSAERIEVEFNLPPGTTAENARYHHFGSAGKPSEMSVQVGSAYKPSEMLQEGDHVVYRWLWLNRPATVPYAAGASFPKRLVARVTTPPRHSMLRAMVGVIFAFIAFAFSLSPIWIIVLIIIFAVRSGRRRQQQYLPPKIGIESGGIKRGLAPPEAALLQELPLAKVLLLVVFGLLKKGWLAVNEVAAGDFRYHAREKEGVELKEYETAFIKAIDKDNRLDKDLLRGMFIAMITSLKKSMEGFSRRETNQYYQSIMNKAWEQVRTCPPDKLPAELAQSLEWLALDPDYEKKLEPHTHDSVFLPGDTEYWYRHFPQRTAGGGGASIPGKGLGQTVTGAAANLVGSLQVFSASLLGDSAAFTSFITKVTNPPPVQTYSRSGGRSGGSSCACACACACAGCACACAGGGR